MIISPTKLIQHQRDLRELEGIQAKFSFQNVFQEHQLFQKVFQENRPPFRFVCLSFVLVMTSLARFAVSSVSCLIFISVNKDTVARVVVQIYFHFCLVKIAKDCSSFPLIQPKWKKLLQPFDRARKMTKISQHLNIL